jgi:hypothetical protein
MKNIFIITALLFCTNVHAVSIFPNKVTAAGTVGTKSAIQFKVYGHFDNANIEFVKVVDLQKNEDKIITEFALGKEQERIIPVDIVVKENTHYYICAVLKDAQSMRLRTCSSITTKVTQ